MKMKIVAVLALLLICEISFGQKLDGTLLTYNYTQTPLKPLPERYNSFWVEWRKIVGTQYNLEEIRESIQIGTFENIGDGRRANNNFKVYIDIQPWNNSKILYEKTDKKQKDGTKKSFYKAYQNLEYSVNVKVFGCIPSESHTTGYEMKEYYTFKINKKNKFIGALKGSKSLASSDLSKVKRTQVEKMVYDFYRTHLSQKLTAFFTMHKETKGVRIFTIKKFKKFSYDDFDEAQEIAKNALSVLLADRDNLNGFRESIQPAIDKWNEALKESDVNNKKTRVNEKVTKTAYLNLARVYFMLKEYDKVIAYVNKIEALDNTFKGMKILKGFALKNISIIENYKTLMETEDYKTM